MEHISFKPSPEASEILEELRLKIAKIAGITLIDNRLYIRWRGKMRGHLKEVALVVTSVEDGNGLTECRGCSEAIAIDSAEDLCDECQSPK